jgi:serine/threonine-protein kinase
MTDTGEIPEDGSDFTLPAGARLGKYQIVKLLGAGGMGAVYEAAHTEIGKRVAVKVLGPAIAAVPGARARFLREAQLTSKVRHPHIVDVTDMGSEGGLAYLVMELMQGEDLSQRLVRTGPMPPAELAEAMLPVCSAVVAAHQAGITHRDLKPQNIFLASGPHGVQPKVLDFGISKGTDKVTSGTLTGTGAMIGTPFYLAPEQIMDGKSAGPASDQYALGVILYECLTGRRPFESDNLFVVFQSIVNGAPAPPRHLRPEIPPGLEQVVLRAMNVDPRRRYASVKSLGRALLPFASARARLLWSEAFAGVDEPSDEPVASLAAAATAGAADVPAIESAGSVATAKVAGRGPKGRPTGDPDAPVPPGTATLDVVSPGRHLTRIKKIGAVAGGLLVALLAALWLGGGDGPDDDGGRGTVTAPGSRARTAPTPSAPRVPAAAERVAPAVTPTPAVPTPLSTTSATATSAADPTAPGRPPAVFEVSVTVEPDDAEIELDGEPAGRGRLRRSLPADHRRHVLRATAAGFAPRVVEFTDRAPQETLVLAPLPRPPVESPDEDGLDEVVPARRSVTSRPGRRVREGGADRAPRPEPEPPPSLSPNGAPVID